VTLFEKPATPEGGGGGWEEVPLPKRSGVLIWRGRALMTQKVEVIFDGLEDERQVLASAAFQTLLRFYRPNSPTKQPAILELSASSDAVPARKHFGGGKVEGWVLTGMEWGEAVGDEEGWRVQQALTLTFTEYREDERLQTAAKKKELSNVVAYTWIVKKAGEPLGAIAERFHVPGGWKALGNFQQPKITDPRTTRKGQLISIPAISGEEVTTTKLVT
jgi:hypothetical protein